MITKITIGISLVVSGYFLSKSNAFNTTVSKSNYFSISHVQQEKTPLQKSMARGKEIYAEYCMLCHLVTGKGDGVNFPPLDGSDWLGKKRNEAIHAVKFGQSGTITVNGKKYTGTMPELELSNQEVADVMNYTMNNWSNKNFKIVTVAEVALVKK